MRFIEKTGFFLILAVSLLFACNPDDDMMMNTNNNPSDNIQLMIPSDIASDICLGENVLENSGTIISTAFCNTGNAATVEGISITDNCVNLAPGENYVGESADEICIIHCYDDESCDTTYIQATVFQSYAKGVFVINEGPFQNGTGTLDFYHRGRNETFNSIYQANNENLLLGNIAQSMISISDKAYIVINNDNKIVVTDLVTMKAETSIEGFELPRYMLNYDGTKAYVSQWGADGVTGSIKVLDLAQNTITKTIPAGQGPERMAIHEDKLYVSQGGGFGKDSTIIVIDTNTDLVESTIEVGDNPNSIIVDAAGAIWVLGGGYFDWMNPVNSTDGFLVKIENGAIVENYTLSNGAQDLVINPSRNILYFNMDGKVYQHGIQETSFASTVAIDQAFYSLGIDPTTGNIFGGDAKDFASNGEVFVYEPNGTLLHSFESGIIPGNFWFR